MISYFFVVLASRRAATRFSALMALRTTVSSGSFLSHQSGFRAAGFEESGAFSDFDVVGVSRIPVHQSFCLQPIIRDRRKVSYAEDIRRINEAAGSLKTGYRARGRFV
jgi:hypothetical protein